MKPTIRVLGTMPLYYIEGTVFTDRNGGDPVPLEAALVTAQVSNPSARDPKDEVVVEASSPTDASGWFRLLVEPGTYNVVAYKDTYDFNFACDIGAASGVTVELLLPDLSGVTDYGYVNGDVKGDGIVTISFRAPGCGGKIEVKSITRNVAPGEDASYEEIIPSSVTPPYEVVASSYGEATQVVSGVTVESGVSTIVNFNF
jgi:hypothetical protein